MARQERTLRIIAGTWRGRKFRFPDADIRPTPDRVRETLFNWLQGRVEGARCLDLYAGSGALGLEALSRGAASVVFVERQRLVADALRRQLHDWQAVGTEVLCAQARQYLGSAHGGDRFDLVFLDPPFAASTGAGQRLAEAGCQDICRTRQIRSAAGPGRGLARTTHGRGRRGQVSFARGAVRQGWAHHENNCNVPGYFRPVDARP